jgi:thioredoxin
MNNTVLEPKQFKQEIAKADNPIILDVRTPEEVQGGKIAKAMNVNWNDPTFKDQVMGLDKSKPVFVYCLSGGRSASAAKFLTESGFNKVYELKGGILNWRSEKLPLVTPDDNNATSTDSSPLSESNYKNLTEAQYNEIVSKDKLVLVDFYATWCGPCKAMAPFLKELASENQQNMELVKIDVDKNADLASTLKVRGLPTLKLYKGNKMVWQQLGYISKEDLKDKIQEFL